MWYYMLLVLVWPHIRVVAFSSELDVRNPPGYNSGDTILEIRRRLDTFARTSDSEVLFDNSTTLDYALIDRTLFEYRNDNLTGNKQADVEASAGVQISCTKCYLKGKARAKLTVNGSFNATKVVDDVQTEAKEALDAIKDYFSNITQVAKGNIKNQTLHEIPDEIREVPPPQIDFNVDLDFPGYDLQVEFEDTELYVELNTVVSAGLTYTIPLYSSTSFGFSLGPDLLFGAVFSFDLILSVENEIEIRNGFHIRLDKRMIMKIVLFGKEASDLQLHGGKFEFLPVTIESGSTVFKALLRLQLRAGISLPEFKSNIKDLELGAGVEARVYANIAEFVTNITTNFGLTDKRDNCALRVVQDYKFAIGAAAGATVNLLGNTYGPTPATEVPIYYTTLAAACITKRKATTTVTTPAVSSLAFRRDDGMSSTTTTTTEVTYNIVACKSQGLVNCPASLQTVSRNVVTKTLTSTVASGSRAIWSTPSVTVFAAVDFGNDSLPLTGMSGKPKSYIPPPPSSTASGTGKVGPASTSGAPEGDGQGVNSKIIIGVTVGVGVPVLAAVIGGCFIIRRKRRLSTSASNSDSGTPVSDSKQGVKVGYAAVSQVQD